MGDCQDDSCCSAPVSFSIPALAFDDVKATTMFFNEKMAVDAGLAPARDGMP
jgi:hypothetical protein